MHKIFPIVLTILFLVFTSPAYAQFDVFSNEGKDGEITPAPICTQLINRSEQEIMGTIAMSPQALESGDIAPIRDNFKLSPKEEINVCSTGPFLAGRKVNLVLRTLIPPFECETTLNSPIYLDVITTKTGFRTLSATCHDR